MKRKVKGKKPLDESPISNNRMAHLCAQATSALNHGRRSTAIEKVTLVYNELTRPMLSPGQEINNNVRAAYGGLGVAAGDPDHDANDIETSVTDTLANIMHFCRHQGVDFQSCLSTAENNFDAEACRTPGCLEDPNDGEGYDGYCGDCADAKGNTAS